MVLSAHKAAGGYLGNNISHVPTFANLSISFPLFLFGYVQPFASPVSYI